MARTSFQAQKRQKEIYLKGVGGERPVIPLHPDALRKKAQSYMTPKAYAYIAGGAGVETTIRHNRSAFEDWLIRPRVLHDVGTRDISCQLFGRQLPGPLLLAPIGVLDLAHKTGDKAVARAAANLGVPMIFSNQASAPMEDVSNEMGRSPRWFQLYWSKSDQLVESLVHRAELAGCEAIVLTLDTTMLGWRLRDLALAYLPFLEGRGIAQYTSDPVFQQLMAAPQTADPDTPKRRLTLQTLKTVFQLMKNYPGGFFQNLTSGKPMKAVRTFINIYSRPSLQWGDLQYLRKLTNLPILLKGVLHPDDASKAVRYGMDGVIVSNHGGRQIEGSIPALRALPEIAAAVDGQIKVLFDSGIRTGADIFKAIALGADAVLLGRPYAYGLAIAGQKGVEEVVSNLLADFELTMGLTGCRNINEINTDLLKRNF